MKTLLFTVVTFILSCHDTFAGNLLKLTLTFSNNLDPNKALVFLDNCKGEKFLQLSYINNKTLISDSVYGKYATITIVYPNKNNVLKGVRLLVNSTAPSFINFGDTDTTEDNRLSRPSLKNAFDVIKTKEYSLIRFFCQKEYSSYEYYSDVYRKIKNDSTLQLLNEASFVLANKQMEFVKKNGNKYYYFWLFRKEIVPVLMKSKKQELYDFFHTSFPQSFQNSAEGVTLRQGIEGQLFFKKGFAISEFKTMDFNGNRISISDFNAKYVLINFWASWCSPCLAKMPFLRDIRRRFPSNVLEMVSVSYDTDTSSFIKAIGKYQMNWINVLKDDNLINRFGNTAIPAVYLIGPNGVILFSSWEDNLSTLSEILEKELN